MVACKRKKILQNLPKLRASNPEVQMASSLDLDKPDSEGKKEVPAEEEVCENQGCRTKVFRLAEENADLRNQVETLASTLREVSRHYRSLKRQRGKKPSEQVKRVTKQLLQLFQREYTDRMKKLASHSTNGGHLITADLIGCAQLWLLDPYSNPIGPRMCEMTSLPVIADVLRQFARMGSVWFLRWRETNSDINSFQFYVRLQKFLLKREIPDCPSELRKVKRASGNVAIKGFKFL
ncbi:uncharacterized protein [Misgurnus anguillicaudatus]|uniref:uncharacterized protein n=1 Tax=Misgurnus anguillicaudatus TaxID=75329 RepID=UPI003CCFC1C9